MRRWMVRPALFLPVYMIVFGMCLSPPAGVILMEITMDTCPPFEDFFKPFLDICNAGEANVRESASKIADGFAMTDKARLETTKGGNQPRYINRTYWTASYFRKAGLVETTRRGHVKITKAGIEFLKSHPDGITKNDLRSFASFADFEAGKDGENPDKIANNVLDRPTLTPNDQINAALDEIEAELADNLLELLQNSKPSFFEKVVVDLLLSMGYGSGDERAGELLGGAGDDGVDGLINQDALGLERVYIQAKRYQADKTISAEAIRGFAGALNVQQASKGLFVTTCSFSKNVIETAQKVPQRIVLIDGDTLARLMIKYEVGCSTQRTLTIKHIEADYFEQ